jgi:RimJ/RimL family protein N-acetyltransferase
MTGEHIYLRILEESDIPLTTKWMNDAEISEIMGYLPAQSLASQLKWYQAIMNDKSRFIFAICDKNTHEHIGNVGLGNIDYIHRHAMFNIFLVKRENRSKGVGTEATRLMLDFAFFKLNLNKVHLRTSERFVEANKMYQRIGFMKEGVMRQHYYTNGNYEDKILYSILKSEYGQQ